MRPTLHKLVLLALMSLTTLIAPKIASSALPVEVNGHPLPSLATMLERVTPSVVNITTEGRQQINDQLLNDPFFKRFFGDSFSTDRPISGTGSGVIIHAQHGHVLTNSHVIEGAEKIYVTLKDGRRYNATIIGVDPYADLAVLQIPAERLVAMNFGDSDKLRVGDFVVAIGNPYSIGQTVTSGIISALHRNPGISEYENFIQTDAPINLGNSGGPLVNLKGELIGINTAILGDQSGGNLGIGFAVPINTAAGVITQIVQYGRVERGLLGIEVQDIDPELARKLNIKPNSGAIIRQVIPNSSASHADIQAGDIIIRLNSKEISSAVDVKNIIGGLRIGSEAHITLMRAGRPRNVSIPISPPNMGLPADARKNQQPFWERGLNK